MRPRLHAALLALAAGVVPLAAAPAPAAAATRMSARILAPLYDAPGATVPVVVSVAGVPNGASVRVQMDGGGWCATGADATWQAGSLRGTQCYWPLPARSWRGRPSATVVVSPAHGTPVRLRAVATRMVRTSGPRSGSLTPSQIRAVERCGHTSADVWLTFDDTLPSTARTRELVAVLARNHARGRFFLNRVSPTDRRLLERAGHVVANHTRDHRPLNTLDARGVHAQIAGGPAAAGPVRLLRPPYGAGAFGTRLNAQAAADGYRVCRWTTDTRDWAGASAREMGARVRWGDAYSAPAFAGGVILMHANHADTRKVQAVIDAVRARGLRVEPLR